MNLGAGLSGIVYNNKNKERMKKVFLILFVGVLGIWTSLQPQETSVVEDVLLKNVEALASAENSLPVICQDSGGFTCPINGDKYGFVYVGYNWEPDEETY